ncbi:MAG: hypothetical protein JNM22_21560 [Saprospiraceae bacterium]|nr:hypothetical protein [Saprospiraceae bacterium]
MTRFFTQLQLLSVLAMLLFVWPNCTGKVTCHDLSGRWTTHEGQEMLFLEGGKALWLTRFGSQYDTVPFEYELNCKASPATIDLDHFYTGPYTGKTLFGILEWTTDTSFRMQYEPGMEANVRPEKFSMESAVKFSAARSPK